VPPVRGVPDPVWQHPGTEADQIEPHLSSRQKSADVGHGGSGWISTPVAVERRRTGEWWRGECEDGRGIESG
jgi:hypothetical protein